MREDSKTPVIAIVGLDLGDRRSHACVLDAASGSVLERFEVATTAEGLRARFAGRARSRVVLEATGSSPWVSRLLTELGHEVHVANAVRLELITRSHRKTDRLDAELLARLGRSELGLLGRPGGLPGAAYDAGGAEALTMDEIVDTIARALHRSVRKLHLPKALCVKAAGWSRDFDPHLVAAVDEDELADPSALTAASGISPRSFRQGVRDLLR